MEAKANLSIKLEVVFWLFTAIVAAGIIYPILSEITNYPFLVMNVIFIIVFITFTRYIFLLQYTFLAHHQYLKAFMIALCIPIIFILIKDLNIFQAFVGEEGLDSFMTELPYEDKESLITYIRNEMLLFGTGSIITALILPIRLVMSIWRNLNRGTV